MSIFLLLLTRLCVPLLQLITHWIVRFVLEAVTILQPYNDSAGCGTPFTAGNEIAGMTKEEQERRF